MGPQLPHLGYWSREKEIAIRCWLRGMFLPIRILAKSSMYPPTMDIASGITFQRISHLDLAEVEFESLSSYEIVAPGNIDEPGVPISIYGYASDSKPEFQTGSILPPPKKNCVSRTPFLFHNAKTSIGMSGSPIINSKGLLVAIHLAGNPESTHRSSQSYNKPRLSQFCAPCFKLRPKHKLPLFSNADMPPRI